MSKILIDAGMSRRGWSRIGQHFKCPQLFAYTKRMNLDLIPAAALTKGSMGHVIQAHQHAIWGAEQGGCIVDTTYYDDPSVFMEPEEALHEWCDRYGGHEYLDLILDVFRDYMTKHPEPPGRVLAVEAPMDAVLGVKGGQWGLWLIDPAHANRLEDEIEVIPAHDGELITITPLNYPGHPNHGKPVFISRRSDLEVQRRGKDWIWDHKHQARVSPNESKDAYAIDGGFAFFRLMGAQKYGKKFGGLTLNLIQTRTPFRVSRVGVPKTPHRDTHLADLLWHEEHRLAHHDVTMPDLWRWPKAMHETVCKGRYGACGGLKMCFFGERGVGATY